MKKISLRKVSLGKIQNYLPVIIIICLCIILVNISNLIYPSKIINDKVKQNIQYEEARVLEVNKEVLKPDPKLPTIDLGYQDIKIEILKGSFAGQKFDIRNAVSRIYNIKVKPGMKVISGIYSDNGKVTDVAIYSHKRNFVTYTLFIIFCIVLVLVGKIKGFKSLIGLIFTGISVLYLMLPLIYRGMSPIFAAIITGILTTSAMMILIGDSKKKIYSATLGAILGVIVAGLIAYTAGRLAHLSGLTMQDAEDILYIAEKTSMKVEGLMFAAILIASLGAIMDMAMSITSAIFEVHTANPELGRRQLFNSGMNVGRDVIGTMSNTLILAFVGSSLTLLIRIAAAKMSYTQLANLDVINIELIQALSGSIGIVLTVPITAFVTAEIIKYKVNHIK
jgi:uncharacterized membrane protein